MISIIRVKRKKDKSKDKNRLSGCPIFHYFLYSRLFGAQWKDKDCFPSSVSSHPVLIHSIQIMSFSPSSSLSQLNVPATPPADLTEDETADILDKRRRVF